MTINRRKFIGISGLTVGAWGIVPNILFGSERPQKSDKLYDLTKDVKPLIRADFLKRQEKAKELMRKLGIDGLLLTGDVNMRYFLNMSWWRSERLFGAIMNLKGDPIWICPAFEKKRAGEVINFGKDIRTWEEHESPYTLIKGIMKDLNGKKLAVGPTVRNFVVESLRKELSGTGISLVAGLPVSEGCRGIKSEKELAYMDLANKITKIAYREAFAKLEAGMTPSELGAYISLAHKQMGANGGSFPLFGPASAFPHGTKEIRTLSDGDIILNDGGCSVEGYRSDVTRTIVFGKPTDKQKRVFDLVFKAQRTAMKAVRPGVTCESIDYAARKVIGDGGFGPGYKFFGHRLGHGIGMEGHEYPYLVKGNDLKMKPGMTFSNEPGIYIYGEFGIRIEDCFVVTPEGGRYLGGMLTESLDSPFGT